MIFPNNDDGCGWLNQLAPRTPNVELLDSIQCDWLIIGAGYTGLSAARQLAALRPNDHIVIVDAQRAGEGASARNSGYLVDSTLNDGHLTGEHLSLYKQKYDLNRAALETVKRFVDAYQVDCDWDDSGKFHATSMLKNEAKLTQFHQTLASCGIKSSLLAGSELHERLGTKFYRMAVHTEGGVMLQPAKLARAMITTLPNNVALYENTPVHKIEYGSKKVSVTTHQGSVTAKQILLCANGFLPSLGAFTQRAFPLTLTASLTRTLTEQEYSSIGSPKPWGLLSAQAMGATVRLTEDKRIMIRNTAEAITGVHLSTQALQRRIHVHQQGLEKRFPSLPDNLIEHSWAGITCISGNSANIFTRVSENCLAAGCYNGGGIGLATHFGEQLAYLAIGENTPEIEQINQRPQPNWLPPQPFLQWGVKMRLAKDRLFAKAER